MLPKSNTVWIGKSLCPNNFVLKVAHLKISVFPNLYEKFEILIFNFLRVSNNFGHFRFFILTLTLVVTLTFDIGSPKMFVHSRQYCLSSMIFLKTVAYLVSEEYAK